MGHQHTTDIQIVYFKSLWSEQSRLFQWQVSQQQPFPTLTPAGSQ